MANEVMIDIVKNVAEVGRVFEQVSKSEGIASKAMALLSLSDEVMDLLNVDALKLKEEFANLDEKAIDELNAVFAHNFDLQNDLMEEVIESAFDILIQLGGVVSDAIDLANKIKAR